LTVNTNQEAERKPLDDKLTWAGDYCKHCFLCINICPVKNLRFENDEMVSEGKCIQCELCMKYCPDFTIEVKTKERKSKAPADEAQAGSLKKPAAKDSITEVEPKTSNRADGKRDGDKKPKKTVKPRARAARTSKKEPVKK
jgi:Pyruvate/2-oxoacid:ferredoxin oxidoreductase delta subunit